MLFYKNKNIKVKCHHCQTENIIEMGDAVANEPVTRSFGTETTHLIDGSNKCTHCHNDLIVVINVVEYPYGVVDFHNVSANCTLLDDISAESFTVDTYHLMGLPADTAERAKALGGLLNNIAAFMELPKEHLHLDETGLRAYDVIKENINRIKG